MWEYLVIFFRLPILLLYLLFIAVCCIPFLIIISIIFINSWFLALLLFPFAQLFFFLTDNKDDSLLYLKFLCGLLYVNYINLILEETFKYIIIVINWAFYNEKNKEDDDVSTIFFFSIIAFIMSIATLFISSFFTFLIIVILDEIFSKFNIVIISQFFKNLVFFLKIIFEYLDLFIYKYLGFS